MSRAFTALAVLLFATASHLVGACAQPVEILTRCACQDAAACGTCGYQRCCGDSTEPTAGKVCLEGDRGRAACRDLLAPIQFSLALDPRGNLFAASNGTDTVFRISPGGCVTRV